MSGRRSGPPRWGWHRLADEWAAELVARAGVRPGDLVVDLGAGDGAVTAPLLAAGARVVAVELHPQRAAHLRGRVAGERVSVVRAGLADLRMPRRPFRVVANPPFDGLAATIRRLIGAPRPPWRADLVVPLHTARRLVAPPGWQLIVESRLPRAAFVPRSPVDVVVLTIHSTRNR